MTKTLIAYWTSPKSLSKLYTSFSFMYSAPTPHILIYRISYFLVTQGMSSLIINRLYTHLFLNDRIIFNIMYSGPGRRGITQVYFLGLDNECAFWWKILYTHFSCTIDSLQDGLRSSAELKEFHWFLCSALLFPLYQI